MTSPAQRRDEECDAALSAMFLKSALVVPLAVLGDMLERRFGDAVLKTDMGTTTFVVPGCAGNYSHTITRLHFSCVEDTALRVAETNTQPFLDFIRREQHAVRQCWTRVMDGNPRGTLLNDVVEASMQFSDDTVVATGYRCKVVMLRCDTQVVLDLFKGTYAERNAAKQEARDARAKAAKIRRVAAAADTEAAPEAVAPVPPVPVAPEPPVAVAPEPPVAVAPVPPVPVAPEPAVTTAPRPARVRTKTPKAASAFKPKAPRRARQEPALEPYTEGAAAV
jgi:hypothetical protein